MGLPETRYTSAEAERLELYRLFQDAEDAWKAELDRTMSDPTTTKSTFAAPGTRLAELHAAYQKAREDYLRHVFSR